MLLSYGFDARQFTSASASLFIRCKDFASAKQDAQVLLAKNEGSTQGRLLLVSSLVVSNKHASYTRLCIQQVTTTYLVLQASTLIGLGEPLQAIKALQQIVQFDPSCVVAWLRLGQVNKEMAFVTQAVEAFSRAAELEPRQVGPQG